MCKIYVKQIINTVTNIGSMSKLEESMNFCKESLKVMQSLEGKIPNCSCYGNGNYFKIKLRVYYLHLHFLVLYIFL